MVEGSCVITLKYNSTCIQWAVHLFSEASLFLNLEYSLDYSINYCHDLYSFFIWL